MKYIMLIALFLTSNFCFADGFGISQTRHGRACFHLDADGYPYGIPVADHLCSHFSRSERWQEEVIELSLEKAAKTCGELNDWVGLNCVNAVKKIDRLPLSRLGSQNFLNTISFCEDLHTYVWGVAQDSAEQAQGMAQQLTRCLNLAVTKNASDIAACQTLSSQERIEEMRLRIDCAFN